MLEFDEKYSVAVVEPRRFGVSDALELGEFTMRNFQTDPLFLYIQDTEDVAQPISTNYGIQDPRQRLRDVIARAQRYSWASFIWAYNVHMSVQDGKSRTFLLYDKASSKLVGQATWHYPTCMRDELNAELGRTGLWWTIQRWITKIHYFYLRHVTFNYGIRDIIYNERRDAVLTMLSHEPTANPEEPARYSFDEWRDMPYLESDYVYLRYLVIDRELQGNGLGNKFFNFCLDQIPNKPTTFARGGSGPQKLSLLATHAGRPLYLKNGFRDVHYYDRMPSGEFIGMTEMERVR